MVTPSLGSSVGVAVACGVCARPGGSGPGVQGLLLWRLDASSRMVLVGPGPHPPSSSRRIPAARSAPSQYLD